MSSDLSTGKTIFILAVVVGCFAVLWPKVFYPMLTASVKQSGSTQESLPHPHVRPERPSHLHPEVLHPALRDKGRTIPHRTIEKQARPGPMPGVRPPMGGGGHMVPPQTKGSGAMGIIMPLYTVGIVIFFVYTIMKVLFKKSDDEETKIPKLKDFHLDPEYRKYVFTEEYLDSSNVSHRDLLKRQERESSKQRRRQDSTSQPDTKIEDEQMDQLRRRLEETEKAMERLMSQMGSVTDKLTAAKITEVLSQAQSQARILKDAAEGGSDEDLTTSEAFTNTLSEDFSLPLALQRHLEELKEQESAFRRSSLESHETDMNHKEEDDSSEFEEASDIELIKQDFQENKLKGSNTEKDDDIFALEKEQEIKLVSGSEEISVENEVEEIEAFIEFEENGTLTEVKRSNEKDFEEEEKKCKVSKNFKDKEKDLSYEKYDFSENNNNRLNSEKLNDGLYMELQMKTEIRERRSQKLEISEEFDDSKSVENNTQLNTNCDRLESVSDCPQENITSTKISTEETNQNLFVALSAHDADQSK